MAEMMANYLTVWRAPSPEIDGLAFQWFGRQTETAWTALGVFGDRDRLQLGDIMPCAIAVTLYACAWRDLSARFAINVTGRNSAPEFDPVAFGKHAEAMAREAMARFRGAEPVAHPAGRKLDS